MIARRRIGAWLGAGTAVALLTPARARGQARVPRIGVLCPGPVWTDPGNALDRFRQGLRELGHVEGRTLVLEPRFDEHRPDRSAAQLAELLALPVDLIVAGTTGSALMARRATDRVPIVMAVSADPVADGLVASLARPGGNVTGMSIMSPELTARRVQLLAEMLPGLKRAALLLDPRARVRQDRDDHLRAAEALGLQLLPVEAATPADFAPAFVAARRQGAEAMLLAQNVVFALQRHALAALALEHRLPALSGSGDRQFAHAGGLANYGANINTSWHRAASFVHRILNGASPAELPVEQPGRFELAINLRTAAALGITIPPHLVLLADEVIR